MFPDNISQNIDILVVINVWKNNFGFHSNQKTQGQKHWVNYLYFKYLVCQIKLRHLNTFLQFRLLFHKPHCSSENEIFVAKKILITHSFAWRKLKEYGQIFLPCKFHAKYYLAQNHSKLSQKGKPIFSPWL